MIYVLVCDLAFVKC